jgi:hypothetical protein
VLQEHRQRGLQLHALVGHQPLSLAWVGALVGLDLRRAAVLGAELLGVRLVLAAEAPGQLVQLGLGPPGSKCRARAPSNSGQPTGSQSGRSAAGPRSSRCTTRAASSPLGGGQVAGRNLRGLAVLAGASSVAVLVVVVVSISLMCPPSSEKVRSRNRARS